MKKALPVDIDVLAYESASATSSAAVTVGTWITHTLFLAYRQHLDGAARREHRRGRGRVLDPAPADGPGHRRRPRIRRSRPAVAPSLVVSAGGTTPGGPAGPRGLRRCAACASTSQATSTSTAIRHRGQSRDPQRGPDPGPRARAQRARAAARSTTTSSSSTRQRIATRVPEARVLPGRREDAAREDRRRGDDRVRRSSRARARPCRSSSSACRPRCRSTRRARWSSSPTAAPFDYEAYDDAKAALHRAIENAGYAHVDVEASVIADKTHAHAVLRYVVDPGPRCTFGEVTIEGASGHARRRGARAPEVRAGRAVLGERDRRHAGGALRGRAVLERARRCRPRHAPRR